MLNKIKNLKLNIRQRVLILIFGCCLFTFLVMIAVSFHSFTDIRDAVRGEGDILNKRLADSLDKFSETSIKKRLVENAELRALYIDRELAVIGDNVRFLSTDISYILKSPERYSPRKVAELQEIEDIFAGEPYITYSPELLRQGISAELAHEIGLVGNIADTLVGLSKTYKGYQASLAAASRKGYFMSVDVIPSIGDSRGIYLMEERNLAFPTFDPRERPWYKLAEQEMRLVYTDPYISIEGPMEICCAMPYYDNDGFAGVVRICFHADEIYRQVADGVIGETGFNFVMNAEGKVIFATDMRYVSTEFGRNDLRQSYDTDIAEAARRMVAGEKDVLLITLDKEAEYYLAFAPMSEVGWSFGMLLEKDKVMALARQISAETSEEMNNFQTIIKRDFVDSAIKSALLMLLLVWVFFGVSRAASKRITQPIAELSDGVREIASGNLDKKLDIHTGDEIEHLAVSFNAMTDELKNYMANLAKETAAYERIATELNVAADIQQSMLPHDFDFGREDFEIYATMNAAKEVGGDFYDFYLLDENHLVITIADVSGKGVPAALFMSISKVILHNFALSMKTPDDFASVVTLANQQLCCGNDEMLFVTVFMGMLDLRTGEFVYVNAGHNAPLVCREGKFDFLDVGKSCMLGIDEDVEFVQKKIALAKGDKIFLYTDGVTEAMNAERELFSEERLREFLNREDKSESLETLLNNLHKEIKRHAGDIDQSDDITMLALAYHGKK